MFQSLKVCASILDLLKILRATSHISQGRDHEIVRAQKKVYVKRLSQHTSNIM
jgi:hypothetical protein